MLTIQTILTTANSYYNSKLFLPQKTDQQIFDLLRNDQDVQELEYGSIYDAEEVNEILIEQQIVQNELYINQYLQGTFPSSCDFLYIFIIMSVQYCLLYKNPSINFVKFTINIILMLKDILVIFSFFFKPIPDDTDKIFRSNTYSNWSYILNNYYTCYPVIICFSQIYFLRLPYILSYILGKGYIDTKFDFNIFGRLVEQKLKKEKIQQILEEQTQQLKEEKKEFKKMNEMYSINDFTQQQQFEEINKDLQIREEQILEQQKKKQEQNKEQEMQQKGYTYADFEFSHVLTLRTTWVFIFMFIIYFIQLPHLLTGIIFTEAFLINSGMLLCLFLVRWYSQKSIVPLQQKFGQMQQIFDNLKNVSIPDHLTYGTQYFNVPKQNAFSNQYIENPEEVDEDAEFDYYLNHSQSEIEIKQQQENNNKKNKTNTNFVPIKKATSTQNTNQIEQEKKIQQLKEHYWELCNIWNYQNFIKILCIFMYLSYCCMIGTLFTDGTGSTIYLSIFYSPTLMLMRIFSYNENEIYYSIIKYVSPI